MTHTPLPVRRVRLEYPSDFTPDWNPHLPEFACAANSVSLLMPFAEPYFVKSVRGALALLDEPARTRAEAYVHQEARHHAQHRRFNDLVVAGCPRLVRVERWMEQTYGWLSRTRSLRFNLAFAAGSETIAFTLARWVDENLGTLFSGADPIPATLFLWHLAEEVEHKSDAFDVYERVDGSRLRYAFAMALSFAILAWFTTISTLVMLISQGRALFPVAYLRLARWAFGYAFVALPTMLGSAMKGHHPSALVDPIWMSSWLTHFDPATGTLPVPGPVAR